MTKAILFDADGMIVIAEMFSVQYCRRFNVAYEKILPFFKNEFQACLIGKADLRREVKPYLKRWKWTKSTDEFLNYWFAAEDNIEKSIIRLIPELKQRDIKCYLATNQEKYRIKYIREQMGFDKIFDKVFSSSEIGFKKPQTEFFDFVFRRLKKDIKEIIKSEIQFWDDKEDNVEAAKYFGFDGHLYKGIASFKQKTEKLLQN